MPERIYVVASFNDEAALRAAASGLKAGGHPATDAFTPYPVHGLEALIGIERSRLGLVTFAGGAIGATAAFSLQAWTSGFDWPVNVGGKPAISTLAFIPITFEATILLAGLATAAAFVWRSRLRPRLDSPSLVHGITDDRFALIVDPEAGDLEAREIDELLLAAGAVDLETRSLDR